MSPLSTLLILVSVALLIALLVTRRRLSEQPDRPSPQAVARGDDWTTAAASLAPIGIVVIDADGRSVFENDTAKAIAPVNGDTGMVSLRLRNLLIDAAVADEPLEQEVVLHGPAGRTIQLRAVPVLDGDDRIGTAAFVEEATTKSQLESIRTDFIANASHELKTPLGAIRLLSEALIASDDPAVTENLAEKIQAEAGRINRLVEDILDLAVLESSDHEPTELDICDVIEDVVTQTRVFTEAVGVAIKIDCSPVTVLGDHRSLVSAVTNLVENALSFSAARGSDTVLPVEIRAYADTDLAVIEVEDHGIGIPERHQERIFERFYRVDRGRSRASGGTGLGLAIVRHAVENHEGTVTVESTPGEGSVFRIQLPALEG